MSFTPKTELAWAAGLFDGEGSLTCTMNGGTLRSKTGYIGTPRVQVQIGQSYSPEVLERFKDAVGVGYVLGPYTKAGHGPRWQFTTVKYEACQWIVIQLWPYLSGPKKDQMKAAFKKHHDFWAEKAA